MDGNVELCVHITCIIGTFETPYTITRHMRQEKTTSVTGGTLIFNPLCEISTGVRGTELHPPFFFYFLFTYIVHFVFIFNEISVLFHLLFS